MEKKSDLARKLEETQERMRAEREKLDALALQCVQEGRRLGEDQTVLRQNRQLDALIIFESELRRMLEEMESGK